MLAAALVSLLPAVSAHIALWHPSGYGFDAKNQDTNCLAKPLLDRPFSGKNGWWMHGDIDFPPEEGQVMELPAGGVFHGQVACHKTHSQWGREGGRKDGMACEPPKAHGAGALHAYDSATAKPEETKDVKGCGLGIAYESDPHKVKPEDFTMISINYHCPWYRDVDFEIPKGLPKCPPGGCTCTWVWIHSPGGGRPEMYMNAYKCDVTGETGTQPLPPPLVARKCPEDKNNCTVGAKQPHYWWQKEGVNNYQGRNDPPFYNGDYGFMNGAQTDLWETNDPSKWNNSTLAPIPFNSNPSAGGAESEATTGADMIPSSTGTSESSSSTAASNTDSNVPHDNLMASSSDSSSPKPTRKCKSKRRRRRSHL